MVDIGATFSRWGQALAPSLSEPGGAWWPIRKATSIDMWMQEAKTKYINKTK